MVKYCAKVNNANIYKVDFEKEEFESVSHYSDIDYLVEADYDVPTLPDVEPNEKDLAIGALIADLINDGDTLQLGIGGIPNAVANALCVAQLN